MAKKKPRQSDIYGDPSVQRTVVVDGYNLILKSPAFRPDDRRDLASARDKLVNLLSWAVGHGDVNFIVVFDGAETGLARLRSERNGRVSVLFSAPPQTADDLIKEVVEDLTSKDRAVTVVTSDLEVARHARAQGATVALSDLFAASLFPERVAEDVARQRVAVETGGEGGDKPLGFSKKDMREWMKVFSEQKHEEDQD